MAVHTVRNIDALRSTPGRTDTSVLLQHHSAAADQGGGRFEWDPGSTLRDDNGTIIAPNAGTAGRWIRQDSGPFNARWFGVRGQNEPGHDDHATLTATIAAAKRLHGAPSRTGRHPQGGTVYLPRGTYFVSQTVVLPHGVTLLGDGSRVTRLVANVDFPLGEPIVRLGEEPVQNTGESKHAYHTMVRDMLLDGAGRQVLGVFSNSIQELSGLEHVTILDCGAGGAVFRQPEEAVGSCQNFVLKDIEILIRNGGPRTTGLHLAGFADVRGIDGVTVNGHGSDRSRLAAGIRVDSCYGIVISRAHLEWCEDGVLIGEGTRKHCRGIVVQGVTGGPEVTNVVRIARGRSQENVLMGITRQHANTTRVVRDEVRSHDINDREVGSYVSR